MANGNQRSLPAELARARDRFAAWRRTRKPKSRIPQPLWDLAVNLAGKHGLNRTARTLKLDYYSLKKRVDAAELHREEIDAAFLELSAPRVSVPECVIELDEGQVRLRVHLKGYSATDIGVVGRSLRGSI